MYLGGLADDVTVGFDSVSTEAPYIGCVRDVLLVGEGRTVDFAPRGIRRAPGVKVGQCKMELPSQTSGKSF